MNEWHSFNYEDKKSTAPPIDELVWIMEEYYDGVTIGYFDGFTMRTWSGSDDCYVTHWATLEKPQPPEESKHE